MREVAALRQQKEKARWLDEVAVAVDAGKQPPAACERGRFGRGENTDPPSLLAIPITSPCFLCVFCVVCVFAVRIFAAFSVHDMHVRPSSSIVPAVN